MFVANRTKVVVNGCKQAIVTCGIRLPIFVETTITMLPGSEVAAALTALAPLGGDVLGLTCAAGRNHMSEQKPRRSVIEPRREFICGMVMPSVTARRPSHAGVHPVLVAVHHAAGTAGSEGT